MRGFPGIRRSIEEWSAAILVAGLFFVFHFHGVPPAAAGRVYNAADLVRAARMLEGIIPADPEFADLDGDGQVTADDLALMLRRVHGQELPVRLEQKTIGAAGGSIGSADTILLTVPPGAFAATETLTLERMPPGELPRSSGDHGPLYQISGIPFDAATSLTVRVAVPEGLDLDGTHVEVGHLMFGRPRGFGWYYLLEDSEPNGNALFWQLGPVPASVWDDLRAPESVPAGPLTRETVGYHTVASHRTNYMIRVLYFTNYRELTGSAWFEAPRFSIRFPRERSSPGAQVPVWLTLDVLEESFTALTNAGFDFSTRAKWPIKVTFKDLGQSDGEVPWASTMNRYQIHLHEKLLDNWVLLRPTAAHEFFHVVQGFYSAPNRHVMLNEATATWFEKYMAWNPATYVPNIFATQPRAATRGMHSEARWIANPNWGPGSIKLAVADQAEAQDRGYALSSFFEYLSTLPGCNLVRLREIYEQIKAGQCQVGALLAAMPGTFQNHWIDFTEAFFANRIFPFDHGQVPQVLLQDSGLADVDDHHEGEYGFTVRPIDTLDQFATLWEQDSIHIQRLGGRSVRKQYRMFDHNSGVAELDLLPDPVRLIGEVDLTGVASSALPYFRLMPVLRTDPAADPVVLPATNIWIPSRRTHRVEVTFPRPDKGFFYMLGVFNDSTNAPYDAKTLMGLSSFIGAYALPEYSTELRSLLRDSTGTMAGCHVRDLLLEGDLGTVRIGKGSGGADIGQQILSVLLPHEHVTSLLLKIDGSLQEPLTRVVETETENETQRWTINAIDDIGWRVQTQLTGEPTALGPVVTSEDARTNGLELAAPPPDGMIVHAILYYYTAEVTIEDKGSAPYHWTTDRWPIASLIVAIMGSHFMGGQP